MVGKSIVRCLEWIFGWELINEGSVLKRRIARLTLPFWIIPYCIILLIVTIIFGLAAVIILAAHWLWTGDF